jgi:hypothetical protein
MPLVDALANTRGANKTTRLFVLAKVKPVALVHDRRPPLLVDAEALRVKRTLAANLATNELAAR